MLELLFQRDKGKILVIVADAEFFPALHTVDLFPQGLVPVIVKVDAADGVAPVRAGVQILLHNGLQPLPERKVVGRADLIFQFMPVVPGKLHENAPFCCVWTAFYSTSLKSF